MLIKYKLNPFIFQRAKSRLTAKIKKKTNMIIHLKIKIY